LLVASDRLSAFDVVLPTPNPDKGRVLTGLSRFWFEKTAAIVPNHLLSADPADLPPALAGADGVADELRGRMMIGRLAEVLPVECVVRGYLSVPPGRRTAPRARCAGSPLPRACARAIASPTRVHNPPGRPGRRPRREHPVLRVETLISPELAAACGRPRSICTRMAPRSASGPGSSSPTHQVRVRGHAARASCCSSTRS